MSKDSQIPASRPTAGSMGDRALNYQAKWGLHIFPGEPEFKEPYKYGWGYQLFSQARNGSLISPEVLSHFWESYPLANIMMFPGSLSGVDVIDVDNKPGKKSGFETLEELGLSWVIGTCMLRRSFFLRFDELVGHRLTELLEIWLFWSVSSDWNLHAVTLFFGVV